MRRSGTGSIKESSKQPMSKQEAASLHASQVPPGIPVTSVNSDGEEDSEIGHGNRNRSNSNGTSNYSRGNSNAGTTRGGYSQSAASSGSPQKNGQGSSRR